MDTKQIERMLALDSRTKDVVRGVVAKDELPTRIVGACPTAFVCNTHDADKPGQHWIVIVWSTTTTHNVSHVSEQLLCGVDLQQHDTSKSSF